MKKTFFVLTLLPALLVGGVSCSKLRELPLPDTSGPMARLEVSVSSVCGTRATTPSEGDEAGVSRIEVLVFNTAGGLDAYKSADGSSLTVSDIVTSAGEKTIVAVVNSPDGSGVGDVRSLSALRALSSAFLADNDPDSFVMYGEKSAVLGTSLTNSVNIEVGRLASRIRIDKLVRHFDLSLSGLVAMDAGGFEITRFFLVNVPSACNYGAFVATAGVGGWINGEGPLTAVPPASVAISKDPLVYSAAVTAAGANCLAQGAAYENVHRLYSYPNPSGSAFRTKLVVEVVIDSQTYSFPLEFEELKPNYSYEIRSLTITRLGNPSDGDDNLDPDEPLEPVETLSMEAVISVSPWTLVLMGENGDGIISI